MICYRWQEAMEDDFFQLLRSGIEITSSYKEFPQLEARHFSENQIRSL
jgi:hypothetical protein